MMMSDLIKTMMRSLGGNCAKAADRIEELEAQVEQVGKQFDEIADINDRLHARWELMKADRDLWKSRCNEPYDESVIAENIKLQAQVDAFKRSRMLSHKYAGCTADNCKLDGVECSATINGGVK